MAFQAFTGLMSKQDREQLATDTYVHRAGSQHPTLSLAFLNAQAQIADRHFQS
ncbi:MAG: hypothetical protein JOZ68_14685 [Acidimicrobiia bacterium]|nr:hypothetical protein [Acidimicrobiia bacterium]MBV9042250.1 hypothetical protein [Acidimicrobiia bacterium]MBV9284989.1 hypothetical protein [Acidimicrobiia bacterium]